MYILLRDNTVSEIIPDINPVFPGIPIEDRYAPDFIAQLIHIQDNTEVYQNDIYDPETGMFSAPVPLEPSEEIVTMSETDLQTAYREGVESA